MSPKFPDLTLRTWIETRNSAHGYSRVLGMIREALTPYQRHWWHVSLRVSAGGLTTTPIQAPKGTFELGLDFVRHEATVAASTGTREALPLAGTSETELAEWATEQARELGAEPQVERGRFRGEPGAYDQDAAGRYFEALARVDSVFKSFSGALREAKSPVQLFPHHFDLSVSWFSGRQVPGVDPEDEGHADEQMSFGFSTGDSSIAEPYFYAMAYPLPNGLASTEMPPGADWNTAGFEGAAMPYRELVGTDEPEDRLYTFLSTLQKAGAALMRT